MTIQLDWPRDVVDRLTEEARKKGLSLDAYVLESAKQNESQSDPQDDPTRLCRRLEAAASIRELRKGNILGPDLYIRHLVEEERRF